MANVVVGVTGGIAAYKSAPLIRLFAEAEHNVQVVATENAFRFIGKTTLEALSKNPVAVVDPELFTDVDQVKHISIAKNSDLIVVAPATASFLAKITAGIADDLLTTTVLAASCPVVLAPAMHTEMWESAATRENIQTLTARGFHIVSPGVGRLTGDDSGIGRLAEPGEIFEAALTTLTGPLSGRRVFVTAGGTREPIDAVRFIGNYSSGKQGLGFARAAKRLGATVHLIAANIDEQLCKGFEVTHVTTAAELRNELLLQIENIDVLIMAAAVADFFVQNPVVTKIKRSELGGTLDLKLTANPDVFAEVVATIAAGSKNVLTVGFAAETGEDLETLGRLKLKSKSCDYIVANDVSSGKTFGADQTSVLLISESETVPYRGTKDSVANAVMSLLATKIGDL